MKPGPLTPEQRSQLERALPLIAGELRRQPSFVRRLGAAEARAAAEDALWEAVQCADPDRAFAPFAKTVIRRRLMQACLRAKRACGAWVLDAVEPLETLSAPGPGALEAFEDWIDRALFAGALALWLSGDDGVKLPPRLVPALAALPPADAALLRSQARGDDWATTAACCNMPVRSAQRRKGELVESLRAAFRPSEAPARKGGRTVGRGLEGGQGRTSSKGP